MNISNARRFSFGDDQRPWWRRLIQRAPRWSKRRPPRPAQLLVHVRYREGGERYQRCCVAPDLIQKLCDGLSAADTVREARVYREVFMTHKSFAEDFDPARMMAEVEAFAARAKPEQSA